MFGDSDAGALERAREKRDHVRIMGGTAPA